MDTSKMREQFEAWYAVEHPSRMSTMRWEAEYQSYKQQFDACMFSAWQASRAAVVVELPTEWRTNVGKMLPTPAVRDAIEAQGLKVTS